MQTRALQNLGRCYISEKAGWYTEMLVTT